MKKIGIVGAMELEVAALKEHLQLERQVERAGMTFCEGMLEGMPVVVVRCGIGKVNAALCVQILVDLFQVTHVVNTGVAGSLCNDLHIGDILVSTDALQHDMDVTVLGYPAGQIPGEDFAFAADPELIAAAKAAGESLTGFSMLQGRVLSGDQFISDGVKKNWLIDVFDGMCCEMEGASIAQAASKNGLPFVILRAISDQADGSAQMDYPTFEAEAAKHCVALTEGMLRQLA